MMAEGIKETGIMTRSADLVFINGQISRNIKENGRITRSMELAKLYSLMQLNTLETSKTKRKMDTVYKSRIRVPASILAIGKMENKMD